MNYKNFMCATLCTLALFGCGKTSPLLEKQQDFIGEWKNDHSTLNIEKDGNAKFSEQLRTEDKSAEQEIKTSSISDIKAPITQFDAQHFTIGDGTLSKQFKIDRAPFKQDGKWHVILNGQLYTKH